MITEFGDKKLIEYLKDGQTNLVLCECGLGDVIMVLPYFYDLQARYPNVKFHFKTKNQDCFFNEYYRDYNKYDYVFKLVAYFNEGTPDLKKYTKPECNCVIQIGIDYKKELEYSVTLPYKESPFVGVSFCNSCFPDKINCEKVTAKLIWDSLRNNGFVPIELFSPTYQRAWDRNENKKYDFIDCTMRGMGNNLIRMLSVMGNCKGMASVATGNFHYGMTIYPEKMLYLEKDFSYKYFTNKEVLCLNTKNPDKGIIEEWIRRLSE
jgi:hypothetical protein